MGVMSCSRIGCEKIMCDIYIPEIGYICQECKVEFEEEMNKLSENLTKNGYYQKLKVFMKTEKQKKYSEDDNEISVSEFFDDFF